MPPPRFSIVLPTHNRADVLPFAIRSALWQTAGDFELLIVGDGCTDHTEQVVAAFDDPRVHWFNLPKAPGIGYANRNAALRHAQGSYIAYLAHDDFWFPDHLARLGALLDTTGAELAYSRGLAAEPDGRLVPYWYNLGILSHQAGLWRGDCAITLCTVAHTRACLSKYGGWDDTMLQSADIVMWHRILAGGRFRNVAFLSEPTSIHFLAGWRATRGRHARTRLTSLLAETMLDRQVARSLRLPVRADRPLQETSWNHLACDPLKRIDEIRQGVVQFQDAVLWKSRTPAGLIGLGAGLALGTVLDRLANGVLWMASKKRRRLFKRLWSRTRPVEQRADSDRLNAL